MKSFFKNMGGNVDALNEALITVMQYSDSSISFPELDTITTDTKIEPDWIYPVYKSVHPFAEVNAINLYTTSGSQFDDFDDLFTGIAMVEMLHLDKLGDFLGRIGGNVVQSYSTEMVKYGMTSKEALQISIESEKETIRQYELIMDNIVRYAHGAGRETAIQFFTKVIADENFHQKLFNEQLNMFSDKRDYKKLSKKLNGIKK